MLISFFKVILLPHLSLWLLRFSTHHSKFHRCGDRVSYFRLQILSDNIIVFKSAILLSCWNCYLLLAISASTLVFEQFHFIVCDVPINNFDCLNT